MERFSFSLLLFRKQKESRILYRAYYIHIKEDRSQKYNVCIHFFQRSIHTSEEEFNNFFGCSQLDEKCKRKGPRGLNRTALDLGGLKKGEIIRRRRGTMFFFSQRRKHRANQPNRGSNLDKKKKENSPLYTRL